MGELEQALAQEISWESVSPSILRGITVHNVRISGDTGRAQSVSIALRLRELLAGDTYRLIPRIVVRRPRVVLDTPEDFERLMQTIEFVRQKGAGRRIFAVEVQKGSLQVALADLELTLREVDSLIHIETGRIRG
ncbi:MAG: hypothetical protein EA427_16800, partial [Spirochaetaceae bacterium]